MVLNSGFVPALDQNTGVIEKKARNCIQVKNFFVWHHLQMFLGKREAYHSNNTKIWIYAGQSLTTKSCIPGSNTSTTGDSYIGMRSSPSSSSSTTGSSITKREEDRKNWSRFEWFACIHWCHWCQGMGVEHLSCILCWLEAEKCVFPFFFQLDDQQLCIVFHYFSGDKMDTESYRLNTILYTLRTTSLLLPAGVDNKLIQRI